MAVRPILAWWLSCSSVALAQQPASDSARRADSIAAAKHKLATVVVTGTRLSDVDERTPSQVEPLDVRKTTPGPDVVMNALLDLPGISLYDDQGARLQPELEVRGFTVSPIVGTPQGVSVFLDGMRVNEPDAQEVNFDLLPSAAIARASLVRGSNVLFGRNSLGGTLLLDTRRQYAPSDRDDRRRLVRRADGDDHRRRQTLWGRWLRRRDRLERDRLAASNGSEHKESLRDDRPSVGTDARLGRCGAVLPVRQRPDP
jgi:hypothetical protein